jgi:hypothetical protein
LHGELFQKIEIAAHIGMASVYDAGNAFVTGRANLVDHEIEIPHKKGTVGRRGLWRRRREPRLRLGLRILGARQGDPFGHEIRRKR